MKQTAISEQRTAVSEQPTVKTEPDRENYPAIQRMLVHALEWKRAQEKRA